MSYGMPKGTNISYGAQGFPDWVYAVAQAHNLKASTYPGHQEDNRSEAGYAANPQGLNRGIDWSGSVADMDAFAKYLISIAPSTGALEQVIWQNPNTGQKVGWHGRSPDDGSYFASVYGGHQDHVHTRQSDALSPGTPGSSTSNASNILGIPGTGVVSDGLKVLEEAANITKALMNKDTWLRILKFIGGGALLMIGIYTLLSTQIVGGTLKLLGGPTAEQVRSSIPKAAQVELPK